MGEWGSYRPPTVSESLVFTYYQYSFTPLKSDFVFFLTRKVYNRGHKLALHWMIRVDGMVHSVGYTMYRDHREGKRRSF